MTEEEYRSRLVEILTQHSGQATNILRSVLAQTPDRATELELEIFPNQEGDGAFTVEASFEGPDYYVLNRSVRDIPELFVVRHGEKGFVPDVPMFDPFRQPFPVNDVIVDCVAEWLTQLWLTLGVPRYRLPVRVVGHDDFGTATPIELYRP